VQWSNITSREEYERLLTHFSCKETVDAPWTKEPIRLTFVYIISASGLEIISRLALVKLSSQTYFCSDTTHFWQGKYPLRHISIKFPLPTPAWCLHIKQVHFLGLYFTCSLKPSAGKAERMVQPQHSAQSVLHLCIQLSLQFYIFKYG